MGTTSQEGPRGDGPGATDEGAGHRSDEPGGPGVQAASFADLLRELRVRAGVSQNALAKAVGADASYLNRLERAEREPPRRPLVEALADALGLGAAEADRLLVAAGHLPRALARLGPADPTIRLVAAVLADESIPADERDEFRQIVALVVRRWPRHANSVHSDPRHVDDSG